MRRGFQQMIREAWELLSRDLRRVWTAAAVFGIYFLVGRRVLYTLCPCVLLTGFPCPGCGLTRAMFSVFRGNFEAAWSLHPFSYAILLFTLAFGIRRYFLKKETKSMWKWMTFILIGMVVFYIYRMIHCFPGDPPMSYYYRSAGCQLLRFFGINIVFR